MNKREEETLEEIKGVREDLKNAMNSDLAGMKEEVREIKNALIQAGIMKCA